MSWKDRAKPVEQEQPKSSWKDRAKKIEQKEEKQEASIPESAIAGVAQGATLGFADELTAAIGGLKDYIEQGGKLDLDEYYDIRKKLIRKEDDRKEKANPKTFMAGEFAGGAATSAIPGVAAAKGASLSSQVAKNAGLAAIEGVGRSEKEELLDIVKDGLRAGMTGAAITGSMGAAGKGLNKAKGLKDKTGKWLQEKANERAVKSLDPILSQQEYLTRKDLVQKLGKEMLDEKAVTFGAGVNQIADKTTDLLEQSGERIGDIRDIVDSDDAVSFSKLIKDASDDMVDSAASTTAKQTQAKRFLKEAQNLAGVKKGGPGFSSVVRPSDSIDNAQKVIKELSDDIPFHKPPSEWTPAQKALYKTRKNLVSQIDDHVAAKRPDLADEYKALKERFGLFKDADKILDKSVARQGRNRSLSLTDYIAAAGVGNNKEDGIVMKIVAPLVNKLVRERGNSALAVSLNKVGKLMESNPDKLGKFGKALGKALEGGNKSFLATHAVLMNDPEYKRIIEEDEDGQN